MVPFDLDLTLMGDSTGTHAGLMYASRTTLTPTDKYTHPESSTAHADELPTERQLRLRPPKTDTQFRLHPLINQEETSSSQNNKSRLYTEHVSLIYIINTHTHDEKIRVTHP